MTRNWKWMGLQMVLGGLLAAAPVRAEEKVTPAAPDKTPATLKDVVDLNKKIEDLSKLVADLQKDITTLRSEKLDADLKLNKIQETLKAVEGKGGLLEKLSDQLAQLQKSTDQIAQLKKDTDDLLLWRNRQFYQAPQTGRTGRIRLKNDYLQPVKILVNDKSYEVEAGKDMYIESMPVGSFTYEIPNIQQAKTSTLRAGETFTIQVYTR